jgi:hypothetical protein
VDYYYTTVRPWCRLYLAVGKDGSVEGTIGVECLHFEYESREITLGLTTNFHAFQAGIGGFLYMKWIKSCFRALEIGESEDAHRLIGSSGKWTYFSGIKQYVQNHPFPIYRGDPWWRGAAKKVVPAALGRTLMLPSG